MAADGPARAPVRQERWIGSARGRRYAKRPRRTGGGPPGRGRAQRPNSPLPPPTNMLSRGAVRASRPRRAQRPNSPRRTWARPGHAPKNYLKAAPNLGGGERGQPAQDGGGRGRPLQAAQSRARAAGAACQGRAAAAAFSRAAWALSSLPGTSQSMASSTRCERSVTRTGPIGDSSASAHSAMRPAAAACLLR